MLRSILKFGCCLFAIVLANACLAGSITIVGGLTHEMSAKAGDIYTGTIVLQNDGDTGEEVNIYQTDYTFSCDGSTTYGEPGLLPRSNAPWIAFSPQNLNIPAYSQQTVEYTVTVPQADTLIGTYWSMLMVETLPQSQTAYGQEDTRIGVDQVIRYGIQMVTNIGTSGMRKLQFLNTQLVREDDAPILQIDIANPGERLLRPLVWVELFDLDGNKTGIFESIVMRVYPETSVRHRIALTDLTEETYRALIVADCGGDDLFGIHYTVEVNR